MAGKDANRNRIGKYEVLRLLEEGADGQLYSAIDTESSRKVVLKVTAYDTGSAVDARAAYPAGRRRAASVGRVAAFLGVVAVVAGLGYYLGRGWPALSGKAPGPASTERASQAPPARPNVSTARVPPQPGRNREQVAVEAFDKARADWEGRRDKGEYEASIEAFSAVAEYGKAIELVPASDPAGAAARQAMPAAMAALAASLAAAGQYERAIQVGDDAIRQYPESAEASQMARQRPELLLAHGVALWRNDKDFDKALVVLQEASRSYGGTRAGRQASEALPDAYLEAVRAKLDAGQPEDASRYLKDLVKAYPERKETVRVADLDAEVLFRLFEKAQAAGLTDEAAQYNDELARLYPSSSWVVKSGRVKLNLETPAGAPIAANTARNQLRIAQAKYDRLDFAGAVAALKDVIRSAQADSPEASEALGKLPGWLYKSALYTSGTGSPDRCEATLREVSAQFPGSLWDRRGTEALSRLKSPPAGMVYVPEGPFWMGTDSSEIVALLRKAGASPLEGDDDSLKVFAEVSGLMSETPRHLAQTDAFFIDKTEVTNEQYKQYADATHATPPPHWRNGAYPAGDGNLPVTGVTQVEAASYAKWRGARLPTEVEWEKAARGTDGRRYPWGEQYDDKLAQHMRPEAAGPVPVGSFPAGASPYGALDMIGNVREWTSSTVAPYAESEWQDPSSAAGLSVARGGAWLQEELAPVPARCATRYTVDPTRPNKATGFRCVRDVPEAEQPTASSGPPAGPSRRLP
jgi:formylglycine-generating enzyme required for sulfatase activity/TolA-binding protein